MDIFWSEIKFWWKRRVKDWNLIVGVPLCLGTSYLLFDSIRNSIEGVRLSHQLYVSAQQFYVVPLAIFMILLVSLLLTMLKAVSMLYPPEDDATLYQPSVTGPSGSAVWPPAPKPPK